MSVEKLTALIESDSGRFGAYTPKGDRAVFRIMASLVRKLIKLESEATTWRGPSIGARLMAAEKALEKYREADDKYSNEGLCDTDVREQVRGFVADALLASGMASQLVKEFMYEAV